MISWIQNTFQHHFRSIFAVLLVLIIVSFVFTIGAAPGIGNGDHKVTERVVFGYNLASAEDQARLIGDASLSAQLQAGYSPDGEQLQNYAFQRAAALHLANELHVPASTKDEIANHIKTLPVFQGQDGQFDATRYASFRDSLKSNPGLTEAKVSRVIADDVRSEKVQKLLSGPGYVQPGDVKALLDRADSKWTLGLATIDYASFSPSLNPTDLELTKFFEENAFRYEISPRVSVDYVGFAAIPFLPQVTVTEPEIRAHYETNPARFPAPAPADAKAPVLPDAAFNAVRAQVETSLKIERAQRLAAKAASDFSFALYDGKIAPGTPAFEQLLTQQGLRLATLATLAPFTREDGPAEFGGSPEVATEAFKLGAARLSSDAVNTPAGAAVLFWKETLPTRKPAFAEVRAKVLADYTEGEKRKRFVDLGRTLRAAIETRLKAGDTFDQAVAASAGSVKIATKQVGPFTLRQPPQDVSYSVYGTLERLQKGHVSDMVLAQDSGVIVYAVDKQVPELTEANPQYIATRDQMASMNARTGAGAYLAALVDAELKRTEPKAAN